MELNKEQKERILNALFSNGAMIYKLVKQHLEERITNHNSGGASGDLFKDLPKFYQREGAISENNKLLNMLKNYKEEYDKSQAPQA